MKELGEKKQSSVEDISFLDEFRMRLAERLEEIATDPRAPRGYTDVTPETIDAVRVGRTIARNKITDGALCRLGQDLRLTVEDINKLRELMFGTAE